MEEIFALSDAITVFKDGRYVRTFNNMQEVNHDALVQAMVGRELGDIYGWQPREYGKERLRLDQVKAPGVRQPISLSVRSGEIVGLFGLVGAGRSELMKGLFGGSRITGGQVYIDGEAIDIRKPAPGDSGGMMLARKTAKRRGLFRSTRCATTSISALAASIFSPAALSTTPGKRRTPTSISNR